MAAQSPPHNSDDDDDDYVPPIEPQDHSSESSDEEPESKRPRVSPPRETSLDEVEKKKGKDALWASFQASVSSVPSTQHAPVKGIVKVEKRFQFAGETIVEVVEVPADSPDAKKWPLWHEKEGNDALPAVPSHVESRPEVPSEAPPEPSTSTKPVAKRPGPRKPKTTLAAIPIQKAKKLSTLEKSAMDWQAHVQASGQSDLKDELEANRRGGGYLEKVEFLNRVGERREEVIEASKSSNKRRRN